MQEPAPLPCIQARAKGDALRRPWAPIGGSLSIGIYPLWPEQAGPVAAAAGRLLGPDEMLRPFGLA